LLLRKRLKKQVHSCRVRIRNNLVAQYFPELDLFWHRFLTSNIGCPHSWGIFPASGPSPLHLFFAVHRF